MIRSKIINSGAQGQKSKKAIKTKPRASKFPYMIILKTLTRFIQTDAQKKSIYESLKNTDPTHSDGHHFPRTASEKAQASSKMASGRFSKPSWKHLERVLELETSKSRPGDLLISIVVPLGLDFEFFLHMLN